jgi:predicted dehydrogenase
VSEAAASTRRPAGRAASTRPRVGFLGVGWIGRNRMQAILETGAVEACAIADASPETAAEAGRLAPGAEIHTSFESLLQSDLDGLVIATPSALHAAQTVAALERGMAVFCQKPLGRTATEAQAAVKAACKSDRLLAVDLSYRFTEGMARIREQVAGGDLGRVHAVDLTFHNAYGPDKAWFYDPALSGGGCVMDLGVHLVDLALWTLGFPRVAEVRAQLFAAGERLPARPTQVEDHALATLVLQTGAVIRLACSWRLHAGRDAVIGAEFYGSEGGAAFRNLEGSFYDFTAERFRGTSRETLSAPPDDWGGRAAADWAKRLAAGEGFDPKAWRIVEVARALDAIYGRD